MLIRAPSKSEIINKLIKIKNTVPGKYYIQYINLKLLDSKSIFLDAIFEAIQRIWIALC